MNYYNVYYNQFLSNNIFSTNFVEKISRTGETVEKAAIRAFETAKKKDISIFTYITVQASNEKEAVSISKKIRNLWIIEKANYLKDRYGYYQGANKPFARIPSTNEKIEFFFVCPHSCGVIKLLTKSNKVYRATPNQILRLGDNKEFLNWLNR